MAIPIIFVHRGNPYYLYSVLKQAKKTNPKSDIILLGDETNKSFSFVKHYDISDYFDSATQFAKVYQHHSPNPYGYELFCFQRWFVIKDFIAKQLKGKGHFFYCDTDTLLFNDLSAEFKRYDKYEMSICRTGTPCFSFFNDGVINKFTDFIYEMYATSEGQQKISAYVDELKAKHRRYGISDMTAFSAYGHSYLPHILRVDIPKDNMCFCHNIQDEVDGYLMAGQYMQTILKNKIPYGLYLETNKWVKFLGIHFQGSAKKIMYKYLPLPDKMGFLYKYYYQRLANKLKKAYANFMVFPVTLRKHSS